MNTATYDIAHHHTSAPIVVRWHDHHPLARQRALAQALAQYPGRDLLLLKAGIGLNPQQLICWHEHLRQAAANVDGITVLSNDEERYNPFHDHPKPPDVASRNQVHTLVHWLGDGWLTQAPSFPDDRILLRPQAAQRLAEREHWPHPHDPQLYGFNLQLADDLYLDNPEQPLFHPRPAQRWQAAPSESHARLGADLRRLIDAGVESLANISEPCLLHITHSWGGGINRWLLDWCRHDLQYAHLVLRSHGDWQRSRHGSYLALYLFDPQSDQMVKLREFHLTPPITATRISDPQYRAVLDWLVTRFKIQRVLVSSIIGHSLDALRTGLPCIYSLHDYYPAWPLLAVNPLPYRVQTDQSRDLRYDLQRALSEHAEREFCEDELEEWQLLSQAWQKECKQNRITLVAPTQTTAGIIGEMNPAMRNDIHVIPHGLPPWQKPASKQLPKIREDDRLHLLIPGRLSKHKGLDLLRAALPGLLPIAKITLLGCDREGSKLLGQSGIDIIPHYDNQSLPELVARIQPDACLLLSVVPETFSYTLSEMWSLGVVPIATELGSFAERIQDYENGILTAPRPEALVQTIQQLHSEPEILTELAANVKRQNDVNIQQMLDNYESHWSQPTHLSYRNVPVLALSGDVAELRRTRQWLEDERAELEDLRDRLIAQLQNRTDWARKNQAQAEQLRSNLEQSREEFYAQIQLHKEWLKQREEAVEKHRHQRDDLNQQLEQVRNRLQSKHEQFEQVLDQKRQLHAELAHEHEEKRQLGRELQHEHKHLLQLQQQFTQVRQQLGQQLQDERERVHRQEAEIYKLSGLLQQGQQHYELLSQQYQQVLHSRSWKVTKPLRVGIRTARNLKRARAHLPWRWPWLMRRFLQLLLSQGMKGTLRRLQSEPVDAPIDTAADPLHHADAAHEGSSAAAESQAVDEQQIEPIQLKPSKNPQVGVCLQLGPKPFALAHQLKRLAELEQRFQLFVVLVGCLSDSIKDYLAQCSGIAVVELKTQHDEEHSFSYALSHLLSANIPLPDHWLLIDSYSAANPGALANLIGTLKSSQHAVVSGCLVDEDQNLHAYYDQQGHRLASNHPSFAYTHHIPAQTHHPMACDLQRLSVTADTEPGEIQQKLLQYREHQGDLLQAFSHHRWVGGNDAEPSVIAENPNQEHKPSILIIDAWVPTPDQDSGSLRMVQLLQVARSIGWHVVFCSADRSHRGRYTKDLQEAGIEVWNAPYLKDFSTFLSQQGQRFDAVMLSRYYVAQELMQQVKKHCPQAQVIFDTVDLHFLREEREAELKNSTALKRLAAGTRKQELALMENSDTTLVVSPVEQKILGDIKPDVNVEVLSNIHDIHGSDKDFDERKDILFIGGFQHPPNIDAMQWFIQDIWPIIHEVLPDVEFNIIGSKMPDEIKNLEAPNVNILGFVPDIEPYLNGCRISVAPLRYGAGVKGKVNSSMSHGQPVVATTIAVEGMAMENGVDTLVADDTLAFAEAVIRLYTDAELWNKLSLAGLENIRRYFSVEAAQEQLRKILKGATEQKTKIIHEE